jgi:hypothetical protein
MSGVLKPFLLYFDILEVNQEYHFNQENVVFIHNGILCSHEEARNVIIRW